MTESNRQHAILIEFQKSRSTNYRKAVRLAKAFETFEQKKTENDVITKVRLSNIRELPRAEGLLITVLLWKSARMYYDGNPVPIKNVLSIMGCAKEVKELGYEHYWCYGRRNPNDDPDFTCGCRYIHLGEDDWAEHKWWDIGDLTDQMTFKVDKDAIRMIIRQSVYDNHLYFCPYFSLKESLAIVQRLPDEVDPRKQKGWKYRKGWKDGRWTLVGIDKALPECGAWIDLGFGPAGMPEDADIEALLKEVEKKRKDQKDS